MQPIFHCDLNYFQAPHLRQIYEGFFKLMQKKLITISVKRANGDQIKPILRVELSTNSDQKFIVYYDTLDGLNWLENKSTAENLQYFQKNFVADYYFKRSFNTQVLEYAPPNCMVLPLGLNYYMESKNNFSGSVRAKLINLFKTMLPKRIYGGLPYTKDLEYPPCYNTVSKVLFYAGLWDPEQVEDLRLKLEMAEINDYRIDCIEACRKEFRSFFSGGLIENDFSRKYAKHLVVPSDITKRVNFLESIKSHNICIATTGLYGSIGWKFAEYIAASRAIVSEPLNYVPSGDLRDTVHYYSFSNKEELLGKINLLLEDRKTVQEMMYNNFVYYNQFVKPENLILNSLLTVYSGTI